MSIATALQVPKTSLTHTLAGLHKAELIRFEPNPKDNRSKCVMLTDAGRQFRETAIANISQDFGGFLKDFSMDEIEAALPLLSRIRAHLDKARD
ncbi:winged helix DNA-binding protein [Shimia abyssi]|uniref:Winged helix DNA-binding protein n=2 Tax=Shimia abyssi TaxID=1662395 RepID=A0A2P8FBI1_9RHOB|nr:winged helix DNA-binding protein [Shimia abyssi]